MDISDEWTQEEFLRNKKTLQSQGIKVLLIDTILSPIEKAETLIYNPRIIYSKSKYFFF
jgi:hypothetical protein